MILTNLQRVRLSFKFFILTHAPPTQSKSYIAISKMAEKAITLQIRRLGHTEIM